MSRRTERPSSAAAAPPPPLARLARSDPSPPLLGRLLLAYGLLILAGLFVLCIPAAWTRGNELTFDRAVFAVVNLATVTGFQLDVGLGSASGPAVPAMVLLLTLGGTLMTLIVGGMAVARTLRLPYSDAQVVSAALLSTLVCTLAGAAVLIGPNRGIYDALLLSLSAFGNGGVYAGRLPGPLAWQTHLVLMPLSIVGGLGLPVLMELYDRATARRPLSTHARAVLWLTVGIYAGGAALLLFSRPPFWENLLAGLARLGWTTSQSASLRYDLVSSALLSLNSRSAGFGFEHAGAIPRATQWGVLLLMAVGASPAGTAGGLKGTTLLALVWGVRDALAGRRAGRTFGIAATWFATYFALVALCFALLLWQVPELPADRLLFLGVSAAGNVGLSHDQLSLVMGPLFTLSFTMLLGRLAPLAVLWWMARTTSDAELAVG